MSAGFWVSALVSVLVCAGVGCRSASPQAPQVLEGVYADDRPSWARRAAVEGVRVMPAWDAGRFVVFDQWGVEEEEVLERQWEVLYMVLDVARGGVSRGGVVWEGVTALMTELEPRHEGEGVGALVVRLSFVVARDGSEEGVVMRWEREIGGRAVSLLVWMRREAQGFGLSDVVMWGGAGREGLEVSGRLGEMGELCMREGVWPREELIGECAGAPAEAAPEVRALWMVALWDEVTGERYVEPQWGRAIVDERDGLGLERREREVGEVLRETQFPPRWDGF